MNSSYKTKEDVEDPSEGQKTNKPNIDVSLKASKPNIELSLKESLSIKGQEMLMGMASGNCESLTRDTAVTIYNTEKTPEEEMCSKISKINIKECEAKTVVETIHTNEEYEVDLRSSGTTESAKAKKGRFIIESVSKEILKKQSAQKKGRFNITANLNSGSSSDEYKENLDTKKLVKIIEMQSKQLDLLFDMVKNISKEEKLFHNEFIGLSNDTYEIIEKFKKRIKSKKTQI
ncbi:hypothetical protein NUSPORA_01933 [Nucleospora cyclopteri]